MSPRRYAPVTTIQAMVGTALIVAAVAVLVGLSYLLLIPGESTLSLPPPELEGLPEGRPGEVICPSRADLRERPDPMPVTSAELIECPALFDGRTVRYSGEAVGAVLLRPTHAWLHLNDDPYGLDLGPLSRHRTVVGGNSGMAVSVPRDVAEAVAVGNARSHGTGVDVVGTFHKAYADDGGSPAIQAHDAEIIREAEHFTHDLSLRRVVAAGVLAPVTLALLVLWRRRVAAA